MQNNVSIAINGLGRMGRTVLRAAIKRGFKVKAVNDIAKWDVLSYLIEFDTVHGNFPYPVELKGDRLLIDNQEIALHSATDKNSLNFGDVDVVIEASGVFLNKESTNHHISNGAKRLIVSAPPKDDTNIFIYGVNHKQYNGQTIISNGSCTTNCIAPICYIINKHYGIESGTMTTIHSYTNDQNITDNAHKEDMRRSRAAAQNIIPTTTGAASGIKKVIPELDGKMHGQSMRVPTIDVSMADLNFYLQNDVSIDEIHSVLESYIQGDMKGVLAFDDKHRVSSDFIGNTHSSIVAKDLSIKVGKMIKITSWYDNEVGFANRLLDMASFISK